MLEKLTPQIYVNSYVKSRYTKTAEGVNVGYVYNAGDGDSMQCLICAGCLDQRECDHVQTQWYQIMLAKNWIDFEELDSIENNAPVHSPQETNVDEHLETAAARSCLETGYSEDMVLNAVKVFIAKYGNSDFKGRDLCEIIFEFEDDIIKGVPMTKIETGKDNPEILDTVSDDCDVDMTIEERRCKVCADNKTGILSLAYHHVISCPQCAPLLMFATYPLYGHMWYRPSSLVNM